MEPTQPSLWPTFIFIGGLFLFMYFMIIRPQNKRNAQIKDMLSKLEKGSEVIAASGILGKVKDISGAYVSIEISDNNVIKLQKSAIANILPKGTIDSIK
jgi:preprotein translocase subunit YajC